MDSELMDFLFSMRNEIKNLKKFKHVLVVLGNETCDLDSAVSSLVYSLFLAHQKKSQSIVVPVFNIPRVQLAVKTEVTYFLKKFGIALENVVCRDEIDLQTLQAEGCLQLTLVDHHALQETDKQLAPSVVAVIDHRPPDPAWPWPHTELTLSIVGSCCTLVADKLLTHAPGLVTPTVATLLLGTILLDTACLSAAVGRATEVDHQIAAQLQARCTQPADGDQLCAELQAAKSDISSLTSSQLLIKDFKVTAGIPIIGLPMKVKDFLDREDAGDAARQFCQERNIELCIVYGQRIEGETITRDIAVFSLTNTASTSQLVAALTDSQEPCLGLQPQPSTVPGFTLFEQLNIKASRKQVLPIVRHFGERLAS